MFINDLSTSLFFSLKGEYKGECNRTVCGTKNAMFYNNSTEKYYCGSCAHAINWKEKICFPHNEIEFFKHFSTTSKSLIADNNLKSGVYESVWTDNMLEIYLGLGKTETVEVDKKTEEKSERLCYIDVEGFVHIEGY